MADLQAFKGIRYDMAKVGSLANVVAPPYDVIDNAQQDELYNNSEFNIVRLILNRPESGDQENDRYRRAAQILRKWRQEAVLVEENQPSLYVYHQTFDLNGVSVTRKGFMGRIKLEQLGTGNIYPHEHTHAAAKVDRFKLMTETRCNLSPIFSLYPDAENVIQNTLERSVAGTAPLSCTDDLGVKHEMWPVSDLSTISTVTSHFGPLPLFIADGHHRYETSLNILEQISRSEDINEDHPANYTLMMCVGMNDPGLSVLPTHRLFRGIQPQNSSDLIQRISQQFDCEIECHGIEHGEKIWDLISGANDQRTLGLFCPADSAWVIASLNDVGVQRLEELMPNNSPELRGLGVSILHELLVKEYFPAGSTEAPKYVRTVEELIDGIQHGDRAGRDATGQAGSDQPFGLAAIVLPASVDDVRNICMSGERMPAKSTYFYPKMLSGLVLNPLQ